MSSKSPIFPMPEPQHFSDYGFDPQIDYFQFMEEARKYKRETSKKSIVDSLRFKLQKPISKEESSLRKTKSNKKKRWWWKNALLLFKWKKYVHVNGSYCTKKNDYFCSKDEERDVHKSRARAFRASSISGPVYITDSRSGSSNPYRTNRPSSRPLAGTLSPARKGDLEIPYLSLRELTREKQQHQQRFSSSPMPIYLVT